MVGMGRPDRTAGGKKSELFWSRPVHPGFGLFALKIRTGPVRIEIKVSTPDLLLSKFSIFVLILCSGKKKFWAYGAVFDGDRQIVKMVCQKCLFATLFAARFVIKIILCKNSSKI